MKNPARILSEKLGLSHESVRQNTDEFELRGLRAMAKFGIVGTGVMAAVGMNSAIRAIFDDTFVGKPEPLVDAMNTGVDLMITAPSVAAVAAIAICGITEFASLHNIAGKRLSEIEGKELDENVYPIPHEVAYPKPEPGQPAPVRDDIDEDTLGYN